MPGAGAGDRGLEANEQGPRIYMARRGARYRAPAWLLWVIPAAFITLLLLRFGMRLTGVRPDIPLPGFIYGLTAPLVEPFYPSFPVSERFDYYAVEVASLAAAGSVLAIALTIYVVSLLLLT